MLLLRFFNHAIALSIDVSTTFSFDRQPKIHYVRLSHPRHSDDR